MSTEPDIVLEVDANVPLEAYQEVIKDLSDVFGAKVIMANKRFFVIVPSISREANSYIEKLIRQRVGLPFDVEDYPTIGEMARLNNDLLRQIFYRMTGDIGIKPKNKKKQEHNQLPEGFWGGINMSNRWKMGIAIVIAVILVVKIWIMISILTSVFSWYVG